MPLPARCILGRMKKSRNGSSALPASSVAKASLTAKAHSLTVPNAGRVGVAIMAAGKGTRLKSQLPKVLHEVGGKSLLAHVVASATQVVAARDIYAIVGYEAERVRTALANAGIQFVLQAEQRGTGHALMAARQALAGYDHVIVLSGDAPLITGETIRRLLEFHLAEKAAMTLLSTDLEDPTGYGRIIRKSARSAEVKAIVEEKSASAAQKKVREMNAGFYAFSVPALYGNIGELSSSNPHGEYYLTDMAEVSRGAKQRVVAYKTDDANEVLGGNTRAELSAIDEHLRLAKCRQLMAEGVTIFYPATCVIGCVVEGARVGLGAVLGPYSHLRPGSEIGEGAHVGNFVETKKIKLGKGSKANHLTYLGDAEIGANVTIGAGTITCNYDGVNKHTTVIEDGVFIGSDSTLVAPVRVGRGSYVGAASCVTDNVPEDSLVIGRARQIVKQGWAREKRAARPKTK